MSWTGNNKQIKKQKPDLNDNLDGDFPGFAAEFNWSRQLEKTIWVKKYFNYDKIHNNDLFNSNPSSGKLKYVFLRTGTNSLMIYNACKGFNPKKKKIKKKTSPNIVQQAECICLGSKMPLNELIFPQLF